MENRLLYIFIFFLIISICVGFKGAMYRWSLKAIIIAIIFFNILFALFILGKKYIFS